MNPFEMVLGIVIIVTAGRVIRSYLEGRRGSSSPLGSGNAEERRLRGEVQMLKERIAVLERLATDDSGARRLDREIEALRDKN